MREDSPRWEEINPSPFDHERAGLRELATYLPDTDPYHVWANVEFVATDGSINEVDALVLTPSGLIVLELKHWRGEIGGDGTQWLWTWAGYRANATLAASLGGVIDPVQRYDDCRLRLSADPTSSLTPVEWRSAMADAASRLRLPEVSEKALVGLKFSDALPKQLAVATLAGRLADLEAAAAVLREPTRIVVTAS